MTTDEALDRMNAHELRELLDDCNKTKATALHFMVRVRYPDFINLSSEPTNNFAQVAEYVYVLKRAIEKRLRLGAV